MAEGDHGQSCAMCRIGRNTSYQRTRYRKPNWQRTIRNGNASRAHRSIQTSVSFAVRPLDEIRRVLGTTLMTVVTRKVSRPTNYGAASVLVKPLEGHL